MASGRQRNDKAQRNSRIYQKIANNVDSGKFYEASQLTKTLFFRYKLQNKFEEASKLLYDSAILLLKHDQIESGIDLARQIIKCFQDSKCEVTDESIEMLTDILKLCNQDSCSRHDFIKESLSWSSAKYKHGHPKVHETAAIKYWEEENYQEARSHFIHTSEGSIYATFLIEYHVTTGYPGEIDLFVTQAVLQILCLKNILTANVLFFSYTQNHPGIGRKNKPYKQPLLNFTAFLLLALEFGSLQQFTNLCEQYQLSISRDPIYFEYLDKIGQLFFGLPPKEQEKPGGLMGVLGDMMQNLIGDSETEYSPMEIEPATEDID